jgi:nucleoside recognition membrane protein YjiH
LNRPFFVSAIRFVIPSAVGVGVFLWPVGAANEKTIVLGIIGDHLLTALGVNGPIVVSVVLGFVSIYGIFRISSRWLQRDTPDEVESQKEGSITTDLLRIIGGVVAVATVLSIGPDWLVGETTGSIVLQDLLPPLFVYLTVAIFFLPLLTEFGLMEFVGTLAAPVFRRLFLLPGRAAVDAFASWVGSGTVGTLLTIQQFENGHYSEREACSIICVFSIGSISFCYVSSHLANISHRFTAFYLTVIIASLIIGLVLPRIPPLSKKNSGRQETLIANSTREYSRGVGIFKQATSRAIAVAANAPGVTKLPGRSLKTAFDVWTGLMPAVMVVATAGFVLVEHTGFFQVITAPLVPILDAAGLECTSIAAPALIVGFVDLFIPPILIGSCASEFTRFVVASVAVTQLIFMSEIGLLVLRSSLQMSVWDLFLTYMLRTAMALPIVLLLANIFIN